jgi:histidine ammonia-lyase
MPPTVTLNGHDLTIEDVELVSTRAARVELAVSALAQIDAARAIVDRAVADGTPTYGVNTGFGRFVDVAIAPDEIAQLQLNLLRSHACGVGEPFAPEIVRAATALRANALAKGTSGVRRETVRLLVALLEHDIVAVVPSRGSLGASGDLAPLAHLGLVLVGEGTALAGGRVMSGGEALAAAGLEPVVLTAKEGLALINGTQFMAAIGALALARARRIVRIADAAAAQTVDAVRGSRGPFAPYVHELRPHPGQIASADNLYRLLEGSEINHSHQSCDRVQDAYSLRCTPQVHGASRDAADYAARVVAVELNAATDNPLVIPDRGEVISQGNFHGQPLAIALDTLAIALAEIANISERRIERMLNPALSEGLPAFLTRRGGLNSGFMITQYVAASLVSENKVLAHPASVDSIPTSAGQEDHVSMGATSAIHLWQVCANVERVLAVELLAGAQALGFLAPLAPSAPVAALREHVRRLSPAVEEDRPLAGDIEAVAGAVRDGSLIGAVEDVFGALR